LTAGNGALMRIAPVAIRHFHNRATLHSEVSLCERKSREIGGTPARLSYR
jgi:hypothetical protein